MDYLDYTELRHHGIDGMKWGKRNGPPYPLSYEKHSSSEKQRNPKDLIDGKSETKVTRAQFNDKLHENMYKRGIERGYSKEMAEDYSDRQARAIKILAGVSAAALAGGAAYLIIHNHNINKDYIIKAGETVKRIAGSDNANIRDMFYATPDKKDQLKYLGAYGDQLRRQGRATQIFQKTITFKNDAKIAGRTTGKQIYDEISKKFKSPYASYTDFNIQGFVAQDANSNTFKTEFIKELQKRGYSGILDLNDITKSGYVARCPVIFLGQGSSGNAVVQSVKNVTEESIKAVGKAYRKIIGDQFVDQFMKNPQTVIPVGIVATSSFATIGKAYVDSLEENKNR